MSVWVSIIVPIALALVAVAGTLLGTRFGASNDKAKWLREERRKAYGLLIDKAFLVSRNFPADQTTMVDVDEFNQNLAEARSAASAVGILGPVEVVPRAEALYLTSSQIVIIRGFERKNRQDTGRVLAGGVVAVSQEMSAALERYRQAELEFLVEARRVLT